MELSTINKTNLNRMKTIDSKKMEEVVGGVTRSEYCNTLEMIITCNPPTNSMLHAWSANCAPYGYQF